MQAHRGGRPGATENPRAGLDNLAQELEELRSTQDGVGDRPSLDLGLLGDLGAQVTAVGQAVAADGHPHR